MARARAEGSKDPIFRKEISEPLSTQEEWALKPEKPKLKVKTGSRARTMRGQYQEVVDWKKDMNRRVLDQDDSTVKFTKNEEAKENASKAFNERRGTDVSNWDDDDEDFDTRKL